MSNKLTGEMIERGKNFVKTIEIKSEQYGSAPDYMISLDIKPLTRSTMKDIFRKYNFKQDQQNLEFDKADAMMIEICQHGVIDQTIVANLNDLGEFLPIKIGSEILTITTGSGTDLENFSKQKKD